MKPEDFIRVGKVLKTSGTSSDLVLLLESEISLNPKKMESVFIQLHGNLVPFFIDSLEPGQGKMTVKLLDLECLDHVTDLIGKDVFLLKSAIPRKKKSKGIDLDLMGFMILDAKHGKVGVVTGLLELPMQELLQVDHDGKEILIPLVEEFIESYDPDLKELRLALPEGLLEIYL